MICSLAWQIHIKKHLGLPIEAMASELPVVASNWNGYRESIVDSETGFLIDTKSMNRA